MAYRIRWSKRAQDNLAKLDKKVASRIIKKVEQTLAQAPRDLGEGLQGKQFKGFYKYRIGDWRVVYEIQEQELIVYVLKVGHRSEVYDR